MRRNVYNLRLKATFFHQLIGKLLHKNCSNLMVTELLMLSIYHISIHYTSSCKHKHIIDNVINPIMSASFVTILSLSLS